MFTLYSINYTLDYIFRLCIFLNKLSINQYTLNSEIIQK